MPRQRRVASPDEVVNIEYTDDAGKKVSLVGLPRCELENEVGRLNLILDRARTHLGKFKTDHPILRDVRIMLTYSVTKRKRDNKKDWNSGKLGKRGKKSSDMSDSEEHVATPED